MPPVGPLEPVVEDDVVRNAGGTILGADNKSAVAAMVEAARRLAGENRPHAGVELVFTPMEEVGLRGAEAFDCERLAARVGFVYDQAGPIGEVILGAPHSSILDVTFRGQAAHAGMAPEEGRSAIAAAARAIADMRLGRLDEETSANVGTIRGGVARNIVPDLCSFSAEVRSHDESKLSDVVQELLDACSFAASLTGCEVETEVAHGFRGYRFRHDAEPSGSPARRSSGAGMRRRSRCPAAVRTRTSSTCAAWPASTWRTEWPRSTARRSTSPPPTSKRWSGSRWRSSTRLVPLSLERGRVTAVLERHEGLARIEVDGNPCVAYPRLTGPVALGDEVIVNTQARELGLGSGGFDVLYVNLTRGLGLVGEASAHVMKLPYTPAQFATRHVEEVADSAPSLDGMPVVCCSLHSQVAPVCAALAGLRVAYVQLQGGALPVALSDSVRALKTKGLLRATATVGACFGGDVECVTPWSAWPGPRRRATTWWCARSGPGSSAQHHGWVTGVPPPRRLRTPRAGSEGGPWSWCVRPMPIHASAIGVSHHTQAVLELCLGDVLVAEESDAEGWREACAGLPLEHMGRDPDDDPAFFAAAYGAGRLARRLVSEVVSGRP